MCGNVLEALQTLRLDGVSIYSMGGLLSLAATAAIILTSHLGDLFPLISVSA